MTPHLTNPEQLVTVLRELPSPVFLLGAGASVSSGVPLASTIVQRAGRWAYAVSHDRHPDDPHIQRSDWYRWLTERPWFTKGDAAANYPQVVEHLLRPREKRAEFFRDRVLDTNLPPSRGYLRLVELMDRGAIHTVLTTNFDHLVPEARTIVGRPHYIHTVKVPSDDPRFSTAGEHPQLVYLHGSVDHYTDQNRVEEIQHLRNGLVPLLVPLLRDRPLVVVGYRGAEPSVMQHLLIDSAEAAGTYRRGVYWCTPDGGPADAFDFGKLHPLVRDLAQAIGGNFSVVPIDGFDELVADMLWPRYQARPDLIQAPPRRQSRGPAPTADMRPVEGSGPEDLDLALARARVVQYCEALDIWVPPKPEDQWVVDQMVERNLLREEGGALVSTVAGHVLFAKRPQEAVPSSRTRIRFTGPKAWLERVLGLEDEDKDPSGSLAEGTVERVVEGTLWNQLDRVTEALGLVNVAFRLKGEVSEAVFPYPALLLKELIVNALVHRDFDVDDPVTIDVTPSSIRLSNPGGLVEDVTRQVGTDSIEEEIRGGRRGIKGYRNPVVTDLFYGAGNMDKSGSGLYDVLALGTDNGNEVQFGPTNENTRFEALVYARPEAVDEVTGTAPPVDVRTTRFSSNTIEVLDLPETVWHAETSCWGAGAVYAATGGDWLPPFLTWSNRLFTFSDLDSPSNPLRGAIEGEVETLSLDEFTALRGDKENDEDALIKGSRTGEDLLAWMLRIHLQRHMAARGLVVDKKRRRAYFPRSAVGSRKVTYQARVQRATRTVAKPRGNRKDGTPSYWEHASVGYRFEKLGETWTLVLVPSYVFTFDGRRGLLQSDRVNRLSTKRQSRDYNSSAHYNLIFWLWVLSGGDEDTFALYDGPSPNALDTSFPDGDNPDAFVRVGDDESDEDSAETAVFDDEGYSVLGVPDETTGGRPPTGVVRLRAHLPSAAVHEIVVADGEAGVAEDDEDIADLLAEEAERERRAAEETEDVNTSGLD